MSDNTSTATIDPAVMARLASGANWFYWIAALSLINAISHSMGSTWGFALGLGLTQIVTALMSPEGSGMPVVVGWLLIAMAVGVFAFFGWYSRRPSLPVFIIGLVLFALDTAIFIFAADWLGVGLHVLALYFLWQGFVAARHAAQPAIA